MNVRVKRSLTDEVVEVASLLDIEKFLAMSNNDRNRFLDIVFMGFEWEFANEARS